MKKYIILTLASLGLVFASCSKDYLNTQPSDATSTPTIFETTDNAKLALNGIYKLMTVQVSAFSQGWNGEGTMKMFFGNYPSQNFVVNLSGWARVIGMENLQNINSSYTLYPWYYYYMIIGNTNAIILNIDNARGLEAEKQFIKAQALTLRAYAFTMLTQVYCKRWVDETDKNRPYSGLVLRLDMSSGDQALATLNETFDQIYKDLDEAIQLFTASGLKRQYFFETDIDVAYATYARCAMVKQDYQVAAAMAQKAYAKHPLMNVDEYWSGFCTPNQEWIWGSHGAEDETLYYWSFQAYISYNSSANAVRSYPKRMYSPLYDKIPKTDIRRDMFLDPTGYSVTKSTGQAGKALDAAARAKFPLLEKRAKVFSYMNFKFQNIAQPGVGNLNHFRSSEMYLIEAEAKYFLNDIAGAQKALVTLTRDSGRDTEYTCTKTGTDLFEEIVTYRAIELWGEGFEWFDLKRWKRGIDRKDPDHGGNYLTALAASIAPEDRNGWVYVIPRRETDYNKGLYGGTPKQE